MSEKKADLSGWERHVPGSKQTTGKRATTTSPTKPTKKITRRKATAKKAKFVVDTREPASMHHLFDIFKEPFSIRTLKYGDYELAYALGERKTIFDFVASFRNTRIFNQLEGLVGEDCYPFLIVTGSMDKLKEDVHFKHINEKTVIGAMASCVCRYGVNVIWVQDDSEATMVMTQLFRAMVGRKQPTNVLPDAYLLLAGTTKELMKEFKERRKQVMKSVAEIICDERVNVLWMYDNVVGLQVVSRMFHKINEGKRGQPRRRTISRDTGDRTTDLVRTFLRVEPALARSLVRKARAKKKGVLKYIMEAPNHELLAHSGMGNVTLKRIRELVG